MRITIHRMLLAAAVFALGSSLPAKADALFWESTAVKTNSAVTCLNFAGDVARSQALQNIRRSSVEVAGTKNGAYIAITCVSRGEANAVAVIMTVAPTFASAQQNGRLVADRLKGITPID